MNLINILRGSTEEYKADSATSEQIANDVVNNKNFNMIMEALSDK